MNQTESINYAKHYPELSEEGQKRTQVTIDKFKEQLEEIVNNTLYSFTCNLAEEITGDDSWIDLRRTVINAMCGYGDREKKLAGTFDGQWWVQIRKKILEENREAIVNDIILDKEHEIKQLQETINHLKQINRGY